MHCEPKLTFTPSRHQNKSTLDCCGHNSTRGIVNWFSFSVFSFGILHHHHNQYHHPSNPQSWSQFYILRPKPTSTPNKLQNKFTLHCYKHNQIRNFWDLASVILGSAIIIIHHPNPNSGHNFRFSSQSSLSNQTKIKLGALCTAIDTTV